jgi:hypothetical protein
VGTTTAKGIPKPALTDPPNGPSDIGAVADWIDTYLSPLTYAEINALSGAALWPGRAVWQTDTGANRPIIGKYEFNGVDWRLPWGEPWGSLDFASRSTLDQTINTTADDLASLAVAKTVPANRHLEVRGAVGLVIQHGSSGIAKVSICDGTDLVLGLIVDDLLAADPGVGSRTRGETGIPVEGASGALAFKLRAVTSAGTLEVFGGTGDPGPAWIRLIDLGPAGDPA